MRQRQRPGLRRAEAKEITRRRLLEAALGVLDETGEAGMTVSAVSRRAGIAQSSFYVHFRDKEDLLQTLGDEVVVRERRAVREARRHLQELPDRERLRETFRVPLTAMAEHPELFRITVKARFEQSSAFGDAARTLRDVDRRDLVEDLVLLGYPHGTPDEQARLEMVADGYTAVTEALGMGHVDGRYPDLDQVVELLVDFSRGLTAALCRTPEHDRSTTR